MSGNTDSRIIVALDFPAQEQVFALVDRLDPSLCRVKVGKELFTRYGPAMVEQLHARGFEVFLDLKFHDIPNTVAAACSAAADLGVWMVNVHALGGERMMVAAREAIDAAGHKPLLIAVTILTSMNAGDLRGIGMSGEPEENVDRLAALAEASGMDGVVCSPLEVRRLRADRGRTFRLVTPGVRPAGVSTDDQQRVMTPGEAVRAGSGYLVIGRPITRAPDPLVAVLGILEEIQAAG